LKNADAVALHRLNFRDRPLWRELRGLRQPPSLNRFLCRAMQLGAAQERKALIYYRSLPAPSRLKTNTPVVDDELLATVTRMRADKPRWEAAWRLRGDIRVAPNFPLVFLNNFFVSGSSGFHEDFVNDSMWQNYVRRLLRKPTFRVERAILIRDFWDRNYFHLLHDILPRLVMAEVFDIDLSIPVVVSQELMKWHGERLASTPFLKTREVIVQPLGHTLCCKELYLLRPGEFARHWMSDVVDRIPTEPGVGASRYVYCQREVKTSDGRLVENSLEIEEIFRSAGFEILGAADMTLSRQKAVFERAETIAGVTGAALANAFFRYDKPLTIGALTSANWLSTAFPTMAKVFGFNYRGFVIPPVRDELRAPLLVPPDTAKRLIDWVLKSAASSHDTEQQR